MFVSVDICSARARVKLSHPSLPEGGTGANYLVHGSMSRVLSLSCDTSSYIVFQPARLRLKIIPETTLKIAVGEEDTRQYMSL